MSLGLGQTHPWMLINQPRPVGATAWSERDQTPSPERRCPFLSPERLLAPSVMDARSRRCWLRHRPVPNLGIFLRIQSIGKDITYQPSELHSISPGAPGPRGTAGPLRLRGAPLQTPRAALAPAPLGGSSPAMPGRPARQEWWTGRAWCSGPGTYFSHFPRSRAGPGSWQGV